MLLQDRSELAKATVSQLESKDDETVIIQQKNVDSPYLFRVPKTQCNNELEEPKTFWYDEITCFQ